MEILSDESQKRYNILSLKSRNTTDGEKTYLHLQPHSQNITMLKLDENVEKELYINKKIEIIPFYHLYFQTIHAKIQSQLSYVNSSQIPKEGIPLEYWEKITISNTDPNHNPKSFILVETSRSIRTYDEWFHTFDNKKELLSNVFNLCFFVLDGLKILQTHDILLLNFSKSNLCFNQFGKPFIGKLNNCIEKSGLNNVSLSHHFNATAPIEISVFDFLKKNQQIHSLSNNQIELIVKNYIDNHIIISNISIHMREKYYEDSVKYLQVLTNKPFSLISAFLLKYVDSWDNYGFHIFFLKEVLLNYTHSSATIPFITDDSKVFWKGFIDIFMKNILCNPDERHNIQETKNFLMDYLSTKTNYLTSF